MANFSSESDVRETFQLVDTTRVPQALVVRSLDDAHTELLRLLDPQFDTGSPSTALVLGETFLAGSLLFRSLAAKDAFTQKHISVGGTRIEAGNRFRALTALADENEARAWEVLQPFLLDRPSQGIVKTTDTTPVVG